MMPVDETAAVVERLRALSNLEHDDLSIGDEAADLLERLSRERGTVPEGWRPIETGIAELADDTLVIVGCKQGFLDIWCGRYLREEKDKQDRGTYRGAPHLSWFPTHWMPRPSTPGSAAPQPPSVSSEIERLRAELEKAREALFSAKEHIDAGRESLLQSSCRLDASGNPIVSTIDPYCIDLLARDDATLKTICDALAASPVPQNGEGG
jgi:hypothetical protein